MARVSMKFWMLREREFRAWVFDRTRVREKSENLAKAEIAGAFIDPSFLSLAKLSNCWLGEVPSGRRPTPVPIPVPVRWLRCLPPFSSFVIIIFISYYFCMLISGWMNHNTRPHYRWNLIATTNWQVLIKVAFTHSAIMEAIQNITLLIF